MKISTAMGTFDECCGVNLDFALQMVLIAAAETYVRTTIDRSGVGRTCWGTPSDLCLRGPCSYDTKA